ncbi:hypothetical protein Tco_1447911 [Tanacetum coccineum]
MVSESLKIWMLVLGEADSETSHKNGVYKKCFSGACWHELGEVNPTHAYYNGSRTSKDNEDPSWNTSILSDGMGPAPKSCALAIDGVSRYKEAINKSDEHE